MFRRWREQEVPPADAPHAAAGFSEAGAFLVPTAAAPGGDETASSVDGAGLLAALLRIATLAPDPAPLAREVVGRFGSFGRVLAADARELHAVRGFGQHSVAAIKLVQEAALRLARETVRAGPVLGDSAAVQAYLAASLAREKIEQFRILFLDRDRRLIADEAQARGTVNHTPVYPREVARRALEMGAGSLLLVHNHPSGDPTPSRDDLDMTVQIVRALALFGIEVADHVIVGNGRFTSFRAAGLL